ncbi:histidine phosphatase family protein [Patescibacteria group bacterium]|nr:histidine phosphatase family protein [Patescibacteria group bacterium]MBU1921781.1 histidine phosphatase family protein [Patescibacteria group bacterium]
MTREITEVKIVVCRHPEKDGDKITAHGAKQCFAAALALAEKGLKPELLLYSGAVRTNQAARVMAAAMQVFDLEPEEDRGFHFEKCFKQTLNNDMDAFKAEMEKIKQAGGTMTRAVEISKYAREGLAQVSSAILDLANKMASRGKKVVLVVSHSPWAEFATIDPDAMPYGLGEADAVVYTVEADLGEIVDSELIKAPQV